MLTRIITWLRLLFQRPHQIAPVPPALPAEPQELPNADHKGGMHLVVIVGHSQGVPGARLAGTPMHEYDYNSLVAAAMCEVEIAGVKVTSLHRDSLGILGAYQEADRLGADAVVELHFNACDEKETGTETLCTTDSNDVEYAQIMQKAMCKVFGRVGDSRGVKCLGRSERGAINVHSFPRGVNCLVEPFFGDSLQDASLGVDKMHDYARALVEATARWARQVDLLR